MKLITLLPFMDDEDLKELLEKIKNKEVQGVKFVHLYPFLRTSEIDELVDMLVKEGKSKDLYSALPFMSNARLHKLYDESKDGQIPNFKEQALLPFLGKDKIKEMVQDLINKNLEENLEDLNDDISDKVEKAINNAFKE